MTARKAKGDDALKYIINIFDFTVLSSAEASILVCIILLVKFIFKNKQNASWHYYIWFILIIRLTVPCLPESQISIFSAVNSAATNLYNFKSSNISSYGIKYSKDNDMVNEATQNKPVVKSSISKKAVQKHSDKTPNSTNGTAAAFNLKTAIAAMWLAGFIIFELYAIFINLKFHAKVKKSIPIKDTAIKNTLNDCIDELNIHGSIPLLLMDDIGTPSLFGVIKPVLIMPPNILSKITASEMKHIFLHELSHLKHNDNFISLIIILLKGMHWFNPIIWYGFYSMHEDSEIACDARVLSCMDEEERIWYGYTIIHLLKITSKYRSIPGTNGMLSDKFKIKRRIVMISKFNKKSLKWSVIGAATIAVLASVLLTNAKLPAKQSYIKNTAVTANADITSKKKNSITEYNISSKNFNGIMLQISDPLKVAAGYSLKDSKPDKTTSMIAEENNAAAAINAGRFKLESDGISKAPLGFIIKDGKVVFNEFSDENHRIETACFTDKGKLIVGSYTLSELKKNNAKEALESITSLIIDGTPVKLDGDGNMGVAPRTAIAQKSDGTVLMLVIDGRSKESIGASIKDVQDILIKYDAQNAALLDGGSSSTMYYKGKVINKPCNQQGERIIPSAFIVTQ